MEPTTQARSVKNHKTLHRALWVIQCLLALLFLFAGAMKFKISPEQTKAFPVQLSLGFLRFIGVCEVLGGLGMVLPGLLKIKTWLTPLAAAGLTIIMVGATLISAIGAIPQALFPFVAGCLTVAVAYYRTKVVPLPSKSGSAHDLVEHRA
jgi:uncharacterized membrane protein YphA (DoxX/SURF4 family)